MDISSVNYYRKHKIQPNCTKYTDDFEEIFSFAKSYVGLSCNLNFLTSS